MKSKKTVLALLLGVLLFAVSAFAFFNKSNQSSENTSTQSGESIRIGSKDFTENLIVAEIYALALEDKGYSVERVSNISSSLIHNSFVNDEIDIYPEYTGTGLLSILKAEMETDPNKVYETVKSQYKDKFQVTWLDYAAANDGQGLVIRTEVAKELGIKTISDLQKHASELRFASQGEFDQREDGIPGLEKAYGKFAWKSSKVYDNSLKYAVLENEEADVTPAYTTEGQLVNTDKFTLLEDDKQFWPPYNLAPVVRDSVLKTNPEIADVLNKISVQLDTATVTSLNAKVDVDGEEYKDVAKEYYDSIKNK
ncbi:glycine betaine ABC transporter substrate-binding protein [Streptococcus caprae]|uniref:Glycine betaine ABC transporter substrate-binding protein n=1 Tax=Streptococcus caprae TaxID=1640501 RepID=A0ABV8CU98_9STRE